MKNIKTWRERADERGIGSCEARDEEISELRAKLAALEVQEPVAVFDVAVNGGVAAVRYNYEKHRLKSGDKLYTKASAAPVPEGWKIVPENMVIDSDSLRFLHGLSQPDEEGNYSEIRLSVGNGHAGHGLYASLDEYPDEGAEVICSFVVTNIDENK